MKTEDIYNIKGRTAWPHRLAEKEQTEAQKCFKRSHTYRLSICLRVDCLKMTEEEAPNMPAGSKMVRRYYGPSIS